MNLTEINSFWRQIARIRAGASYNNITRAGTARGILSYTAGEVARNEPTPAGNKYVVWSYWQNGTTAKDREEVRGLCEGNSGLTINGDELFVCTTEIVEKLKEDKRLLVIGVYNLNLFEHGNKEVHKPTNKGYKGNKRKVSGMR